MRGISDKTLADLGWPQLIEYWAGRTHTGRGAAAVRAIVIFETPDEARARVALIDEVRALLAIDAALPFGGVEDVRQALVRAEKGSALESEDLLAVARTARGLAGLAKHLGQHGDDTCPQLAAIGAAIEDLGHVYHPILESFEPDGTLADHASDELGPLRRKHQAAKAALERRMRTLVEDKKYTPFLQDRYYTQRDDRYVVPVDVDSKGYVRGIVHGTSQSGRTVFVEPEEIVGLGNQLKLAECAVADEERRILRMLSSYVAEEADTLRGGMDAAEALDVVAAAGKLSYDLNATAPALDDAAGLSLPTARHPLMVLSGRPCVPNDIVVAPRTGLIISGPNAGGKTVALKTAGLAALMARAGLHVPAEAGCRLGWFTGIESDIGDSQSIEMDLSTFSAHMVQLERFIAGAGAHTLYLLDEVAVGTEPEQGAALAQSVLEALVERGATLIVTTHYERLKALGATDERFANASVGFDMDAMEPTFKLHLGTPGSSGALHVARRMGLPEPVCARAEALIGERRASVEELLAAVSDERRKLEEERAALLMELEDAEAARLAAEAARDAAREKARKAQSSAHNEAVAALRQAREELERLKSETKQRRTDRGTLRKRVDALSAQVAQLEPSRPLPPGKPATDEALIVGTPVIVPSLGGRATVAQAPSRGRVVVQVGSLKSTVRVADVLIDTHKQASEQKAAQRARVEKKRPQIVRDEAPVELVRADDEGRATLRTPDATCDVRGERAHEAIADLDRFLDRSLMEMRDVVFVIHGHGTGALRRAVREHLAAHRAVEKFRAGEPGEGGDGVTVVFLAS